MSQAPAVAPLAKVVRAIPVEVSVLLTLRATIAEGGSQRVRGRGAVFWVWSISRALTPRSVAMNMCIKLLEVVNNALSCKAGMDEVRDEELFRVSNDI